MAGGGQGGGGMGGGQGAGGMGGPVSGTMGGAGGDLGTASYMNKGGFDGGFGGGYGGGMGGFGGGYGMGSPFGGYGGGMGGYGMGSPFGGFGMGSPFGGFGGMPMYGGYGGGMGGYGGFGGMPMYGGYGGGMGLGGFNRGMGSPFGGMRGGFRGRAPLPDQLARPAVEPRQPDQFPGDARPAVMPQQNRIPETVGTWGSVPQQPAPEVMTGGPAEVINKGMTKPYIEPAASAAPQIPSIQEKEAKLNDQLRYSKPGSADEAYNQELAMYNSPQYAAYYNSLPPSTRAFMNKPGDPARGRYLAEQARSNYQAFGPGGGFKAGGIASLRRYATGGSAKEGTGDNENVPPPPKDPYVPEAKPVDISDRYQTYKAPTHTVYRPETYAYKPTAESMLGRNVRPEIMAKKYSLPPRLVKPGTSYYGPYQSNPKGISGLLK